MTCHSGKVFSSLCYSDTRMNNLLGLLDLETAYTLTW